MKLFAGILIAVAMFFASQNKLAGANELVTCKDRAIDEVRELQIWCPAGWKPTKAPTRTV